MFDKAMYINDKKSTRRGHRPKSAIGGFSILVGLIVAAIYASLIFMSKNDELSQQVPGLCALDLLMSISGIYLALKGGQDNFGSYRDSIIGLIINTIMFIILVVMFLIGIS